MSAITSFTGAHRFLSNFFIEPDNTHVEGEYQAAKWPPERGSAAILFEGLTPGQCKRMGRRIALRKDWNKVKVGIMRELVWQKFVDHPRLADMLLATGTAKLVEGNNWHDHFWGVCDGEGENWLGIILMETRAKLKEARDKGEVL